MGAALDRGIVDMVVAVVAFTVMLACAKLAGAWVSPAELVVWRGVLGAVALAPWVGGGVWRVSRPRLLLLRTVLGASAMVCFYGSVRGLSLAEASLIQKIQPVLVSVGAPWFLGASERPAARTWVAVGLGLAGTAVILAPGGWSGSWWGLLAIAAATLSAGAHLTVRSLGHTEDRRTIVFWFQVGAALFAWTLGSAIAGAPIGAPPSAAWPAVLGVATSATIGQLFMTRAYQRTEAAPVAATSYLGPAVAAGLDLVVFGALPGPWTWVGGALVITAGVLLLLRRSAR